MHSEGDFRSQCIRRHGIDPQSRNMPSPASEELKSCDDTMGWCDITIHHHTNWTIRAERLVPGCTTTSHRGRWLDMLTPKAGIFRLQHQKSKNPETIQWHGVTSQFIIITTELSGLNTWCMVARPRHTVGDGWICWTLSLYSCYISVVDWIPWLLYNVILRPGGGLNKKDSLTRYGDSHVKDKTS